MQLPVAKPLPGWSQSNVFSWLAALPAVLLVVCVADLWYERDDALTRVAIALSALLLASGFLFVRASRRRVAANAVAIRHELDEFRHVFETSLDLIFVTDRQGRFTRVSPSARAILGYRPEEMVGHSAIDFIHLDDLQSTRNEMRLARRGREIRNFETRYLHKAGHAVTLNWTGVWSEAEERHFFIGRDMTEQKRLQAAERDAKKTLAAVIDACPVAIVCLSPDRKVLLWSRAAEQIFGYTAEEMSERGYMLVPPENQAEFDDLFARAMAGETLRDVRVKRRRKDGSLVDISINAAAIFESGTAKAVAFALTDVTERNKLEEQLRQSQKMDAVGQLTGGVAHDFNNVLAVITGTIDILHEGVADRPELAAIAKLISEAADRGADLTKHLLAFARRQPLQPRRTDIGKAAAEAVSLLRPASGEQVEIEWRLCDDVWPALVDPAQLVTAILNLAVNARDAMADGGKLTIETGNAVLDDAYADAHSEVAAGSYAMLAVSDTGPGIPAAIRNKIFEPFFTTKEVGKGTGLGLSMVYGFVKQSGGHIKLYSEEGYGTTFKIYLPRAGGGETDDVAESAGAAPLVGGRETILVVEDDPVVRAAARVQLESMGYKPLTAANAQEALAIIDHGVGFDLLLTDVVMPGPMNGRRLAEEAAKRRIGLKVLFTSGYTENAIIHHGRLDPGVLLLPKPYRKADLARMVRQALAGNGAAAADHPEA
jgi:PAS domain S-box-containing protein